MKQRFKVDIRETYRKTIDVIAEDVDALYDEVATMQEAGEIEWDRAYDYDGFEFISVTPDTLLDSEKEEVRKWALNTVRITRLIDPEWVLEEITETDCMDWLECMRDKGIDIPVLATSSDLWEAVQKERGVA